jgi:hypothetical protein
LWPLLLVILAIKQTVLCGRIGKRESGKSFWTQFREQVWLGLKVVILPQHYYIFELFDADRAKVSPNYLLKSHLKRGVYRLLAERSRPTFENSPFRDKRLFAELCATAELPTLPSIMSFKRGRVIFPSNRPICLPPTDLFIKRAEVGAEKWLYLKHKWHDGAVSLSEAELVERCKTLSRCQELMLQEVAKNHPAFISLNMGGLATLRIITILDTAGRPECHFAVLRMPGRNGAVVDNFYAGGIAAAIDPGSGMVGQATNIGLNRRTEWHKVHPSSGSQIEGLTIPRFKEALDLATRAHAKFLGVVIAAWDIVITEGGVVIVDGIDNPDLDIVQRTHRMPLGGTRFADLLAWHVALADRSK